MISACCSTPTNCHGGEADEVGESAADRPPQTFAQPPPHDEQHRDDAAGDVHREDAEQRQDR
jgi:hypothetical protein